MWTLMEQSALTYECTLVLKLQIELKIIRIGLSLKRIQSSRYQQVTSEIETSNLIKIAMVMDTRSEH